MNAAKKPGPTTILFGSPELGAWHRVALLILVLAGVVLGLAACEPKPPKPKVFFITHERSLL
jgi:hypothetical protein